MQRHKTGMFIAVVAVLAATSIASAQRGRSDDQRGIDAKTGTYRGTIVALVKAGTNGSPFETLRLAVAPGRTESVFVGSESRVRIPGLRDESEQSRQFLMKGMRAEVRWRELLDERTGGRLGFLAESVTLESEWIEGRITAIRRNRLTVQATPRSDRDPYEDGARRIDVRQRRKPDPAEEMPDQAPPKPQNLNLTIFDDKSEMTADGKEFKTGDLTRLKVTPKDGAEFQALILNGPGYPVVALHLKKPLPDATDK